MNQAHQFMPSLTNPTQLALDFDSVTAPEDLDVRLKLRQEQEHQSRAAEHGDGHAINHACNHACTCDGCACNGCTCNVCTCKSIADGFQLAPQLDRNGQPQPIPYQLKQSSKARQVYLRVEPGRGLQVTIPKRYSKRSIPALVESQREWITAALIDLDKRTPAIYRQWPPPQLHLRACQTMVNVHYTDTPKAVEASAYWESADRLQLVVDTKNKPMVAQCIAKALKPRAKQVLGPWLERCAAYSRLSYKRMVIRGQKTVWGSYSSSGTLSLNYKLLFVNPDIVDYVLLHELAHTRHLDHSAAFWRFLDDLKPNSRQLDRQLKEAGTQVPPWLELAGSS